MREDQVGALFGEGGSLDQIREGHFRERKLLCFIKDSLSIFKSFLFRFNKIWAQIFRYFMVGDLIFPKSK